MIAQKKRPLQRPAVEGEWAVRQLGASPQWFILVQKIRKTVFQKFQIGLTIKIFEHDIDDQRPGCNVTPKRHHGHVFLLVYDTM